jgi:hypothetical protein
MTLYVVAVVVVVDDDDDDVEAYLCVLFGENNLVHVVLQLEHPVNKRTENLTEKKRERSM